VLPLRGERIFGCSTGAHLSPIDQREDSITISGDIRYVLIRLVAALERP
jgi:hypothetical protein